SGGASTARRDRRRGMRARPRAASDQHYKSLRRRAAHGPGRQAIRATRSFRSVCILLNAAETNRISGAKLSKSVSAASSSRGTVQSHRGWTLSGGMTKVTQMLKAPHTHARRSAGQTIVVVAIVMPLVFALAGLVIDGSQLLVKKRNTQTAADAAALAVAQNINLSTGLCDAACADKAREYAEKNGVDV